MIASYAGKVAVVTGTAHGLGRALAWELAARGCHVALIDVDAPALAEVGTEFAKSERKHSAHCADVASEERMQAVAADVKASYGAIDLLINNAGISISAPFTQTAAADFERLMRVNFWGAVYTCRAFLPLFPSGGGQILNVSSCFAWHGYPGKSAYAASKGALRSFSESLRIELAGQGIGVTELYPGPLPTGIVASGISDSEEGRAREHAYLARRGLPPARVASRALDRLTCNPARIVIGRDYRAFDLLARLSPALAGRVFSTIGLLAWCAGENRRRVVNERVIQERSSEPP